MKVYILTKAVDYEGCHIDGVFATRELARLFIEDSYELDKWVKNGKDHWRRHEETLCIDSWVVQERDD